MIDVISIFYNIPVVSRITFLCVTLFNTSGYFFILSDTFRVIRYSTNLLITAQASKIYRTIQDESCGFSANNPIVPMGEPFADKIINEHRDIGRKLRAVGREGER